MSKHAVTHEAVYSQGPCSRIEGGTGFMNPDFQDKIQLENDPPAGILEYLA